MTDAPQETKLFHIDTIVSAMTGKLLSDTARQEYTQLLSHVFKDVSFQNDVYGTNVTDMTNMMMFGLVHKYPEIQQVAFEMVKQGAADDPKKFLTHLKTNLGLESERIEVQPFDAELMGKLQKIRMLARDVIARMQLAENLAEQNNVSLFYMPSDMLSANAVGQDAPQEVFRRPRNITLEEEAALKVFPDLVFAPDVQKNILSICKGKKIPVTTDSFRKLEKEVEGKKALFLGVTVSAAQYDSLRQVLEEAGIGRFIEKRPIKHANPEKTVLAIDIAALDNSFEAQSSLSLFKEKMLGPDKSGPNYSGM